MSDNISRALVMMADSVTSGYSALFTFAVRETLTALEREQVSLMLKDLASKHEQKSMSNIPYVPRI